MKLKQQSLTQQTGFWIIEKLREGRNEGEDLQLNKCFGTFPICVGATSRPVFYFILGRARTQICREAETSHWRSSVVYIYQVRRRKQRVGQAIFPCALFF